MNPGTPSSSPGPAGSGAAGKTEIYQALLADSSAWAQHYSVVRMTVTTFLLGLAIGILTTKWNDLSVLLWFVIWGLWFLALSLFVIFTGFEAKELVRRYNNRNRLLEQLDSQLHVDVTQKAAWYEIFPGHPDRAMRALFLATFALLVLFVIWLCLPDPHIQKFGWSF